MADVVYIQYATHLRIQKNIHRLEPVRDILGANKLRE